MVTGHVAAEEPVNRRLALPGFQPGICLCRLGKPPRSRLPIISNAGRASPSGAVQPTRRCAPPDARLHPTERTQYSARPARCYAPEQLVLDVRYQPDNHRGSAPSGGSVRGYPTSSAYLATPGVGQRANGRPYVYASAPSGSTFGSAAWGVPGEPPQPVARVSRGQRAFVPCSVAVTLMR